MLNCSSQVEESNASNTNESNYNIRNYQSVKQPVSDGEREEKRKTAITPVFALFAARIPRPNEVSVGDREFIRNRNKVPMIQGSTKELRIELNFS